MDNVFFWVLNIFYVGSIRIQRIAYWPEDAEIPNTVFLRKGIDVIVIYGH